MTDDSSGRIVTDLRSWIATAAPGAPLPSTRTLVTRYQASPVTVQRAVRVLAGQGLVETRPGVGTFVRGVRSVKPADYDWQTTALRPPQARVQPVAATMRTAANDAIALHSGYPDTELLPGRLVRSALARAARGDAALNRPPAAGLPELQAWFAAELGAVTAPGLTAPGPNNVVIVPGSQSGLSSAFRGLVAPGRPVLMESPTYYGAIKAAAQAGVHAVPVPSGPHGPDPDELDRAFAQTGSRLLYVQPNYANPTGTQWTPERGDQILAVARRHGAFVLEDDWAHDFGITTDVGTLAARDDDGHVVYLRSLTKSVSPSIRVAAVIARGPARERILADRGAESMYVSALLQAAALDVVTQPAWQSYLRALRQHLRARRDLMLASVREHVPQAHVDQVPPGGLNVWVRLPDTTDVEQLSRDCEADGVLVAPGTDWFPAEPTGAYVRLNYAGPNPTAFPDAARLLARALERNHGR
jgi:DNA-binding transcriptional MocR family regulator